MMHRQLIAASVRHRNVNCSSNFRSEAIRMPAPTLNSLTRARLLCVVCDRFYCHSMLVDHLGKVLQVHQHARAQCLGRIGLCFELGPQLCDARQGGLQLVGTVTCIGSQQVLPARLHVALKHHALLQSRIQTSQGIPWRGHLDVLAARELLATSCVAQRQPHHAVGGPHRGAACFWLHPEENEAPFNRAISMHAAREHRVDAGDSADTRRQEAENILHRGHW
mmetsp:Transcript_140868/g.450366  ORF Transcript_140868/g.450366 Transcript_140868/m.450366 type:complete len:222 (+) Transcript_140868:136-801(+)